MRVRVSVVVLIVSVGAWLVWWSAGRNADRPAPPIAVESISPVDSDSGAPAGADAQRPAAPRATSAGGPAAGTMQPAPDPALEGPCWERLRQNVDEKAYQQNLGAVLNGTIERWFYMKDEPVTAAATPSKEDAFLRGMLYAGLMDGRQAPRDDEKALELLKEASELDKSNSAPLLFIALIEDRRGNKEAAQAALRQASTQTQRFDSYITSISKQIMKNVRTPEELLAAQSTIIYLPALDSVGLASLLSGHGASPFFAAQLMKGAQESENQFEYVEFIQSEYTLGEKLLKERDIDVSDIFEKKKAAAADEWNRYQERLNANCTSSALQPLVDNFRAERFRPPLSDN